MLLLSEIRIYPIKSLGGISLPQALVEPRGLQFDRRWMLTDSDGNFVTQREIPEMALLGTAMEPPFLSVFLKNNPSEKIQIPLVPEVAGMEKKRVQVWSQRCTARRHNADINTWFSDILTQKLELVFMPSTTRRPTDGRYAPRGQHVSFADAFPFLIIGQASLDELNRQLIQPLPMDRFRPNLVFTGGAPHDEDHWKQFSINEVPFTGVKPCARCPIPTIDQQTATRTAEPLKTLATYRKRGNKVLFGQNAIWLGNSKYSPVVRVGDAITVHSSD